MIRELKIGEIIKIHDKIINRTGGCHGFRSSGDLDFILKNMKIKRGIYKKSAVLIIGIVRNHPFIDGNKRTGFSTLRYFLAINNKKFEYFNTDSIYDFVFEIAQGKVGFKRIREWIINHTR